jgi:membrane fusion protein, multidrug efflux system
MPHLFKRTVSLTVLAAGLSLFLAACSKPAVQEEPIRAVKVFTVGISDFDAASEFAGEVRARVESRLGFRVAGKMVKRQVELGQRVKAGQVLAQLDAQDYKLAADAARAQLAAAATNRDLAAADFRRYKDLKDQNYISGAELERRETALKAAQAQFEQAQAQLSSQGNQAGYTSLVADVSGVVTAVEAEQGQVVSAGTPIVRIAADGPRDVVFAVPEDKVAVLKVGSPVAVRAWAQASQWTGAVREIAASTDPVTRTFAVKVALAGADAPALGTTVYALPSALGHAGVKIIKIPTSALKQDGKSSAVWVLDVPTMTVKSQPITVATADGNDAVISAGLEPGMQVVAAGVHVLSPGQKVTLYAEKMAPDPVSSAQVATKVVADSGAAPAAVQAASSSSR